MKEEKISINVNCFDEYNAKQELKKCPKIIRDYFKLIEQSRNSWKKLTQDAIVKLRELDKLKP